MRMDMHVDTRVNICVDEMCGHVQTPGENHVMMKVAEHDHPSGSKERNRNADACG